MGPWYTSPPQWYGQSHEHQFGGSAVRSGVLNNSSSNAFSTTVTGPGTLSFLWKVSCQETWDWLEFRFGHQRWEVISGETDWQEKSYDIGPGTTTVTWRYWKGSDGVAGQDCGWVDNIRWEPAEVDPEPYPYQERDWPLTTAHHRARGMNGMKEIIVSPDGLHAYALAQEDEMVSCFSRDVATGVLTFESAVEVAPAESNEDIPE